MKGNVAQAAQEAFGKKTLATTLLRQRTNERIQSISRDVERYRETLRERDLTIEELEKRNTKLETSQSSMAGEASAANDVKLTARELSESIRTNVLTSKIAT